MLHELSKKLTGDRLVDDNIIREEFERIEDELCINCIYHTPGSRKKYVHSILFPEPEKTLAEEIDEWFMLSDGKYPSGRAWRRACQVAVTKFAEQHLKRTNNART